MVEPTTTSILTTRKEKNIASFMLKLQRCKEELESDKIFEANKNSMRPILLLRKVAKVKE